MLRLGPGGFGWCASGLCYAASSDAPRGPFPNSLVSTGAKTGEDVNSCRMVTPADATLTPVAEADFGVVRDLAGTIWRQHYAGIISAAQIDFMLAARFGADALRESLNADGPWLELLRVSGLPVGYCGYELAQIDGSAREAAAMKLGQLYVLASHRGAGLGGFMLGRVEGRARELGSRMLWLQVNRRNAVAIEFYRRMGFDVVREAVFDIGAGFVMDDYVMAKPV